MRKLITRITVNSFLIADQERKGERDTGREREGGERGRGSVVVGLGLV